MSIKQYLHYILLALIAIVLGLGLLGLVVVWSAPYSATAPISTLLMAGLIAASIATGKCLYDTFPPNEEEKPCKCEKEKT